MCSPSQPSSGKNEQKSFLMGRKTCIGLFTLTTFAVWAAFVYVIVTPTKQETPGNGAVVESPAATDSSASGNPGVSTEVTTPVPVSRKQAMAQRLGKTTDFDILMDVATPQNMALEWLVSHDARQLEPQHPDVIQRYVLATLFFATDSSIKGEGGSSSKWLTSLHECEWDFITCNDQVGVQKRMRHRTHKDMADEFDVQKAAVSDVDIGSFPDRKVIKLDLQGRNVIGQIPLEIGSLHSLTSLHLGSNELVGELPNTWAGLENLETLRLDNNYLRGPIPSSFADLTNLGVLTLNDNLFSGVIPEFLGTLTKLGELRLGNNQFSGMVPHEVCSLEAFNASSVEALPDVTCGCCDEAVITTPESMTASTELSTMPAETESTTGSVRF